MSDEEKSAASELAALRAELAAVHTRLAQVEDVQAIQKLKARYGELADSRYTRKGPRSEAEIARIADEIALLFSEDATWDGGATLGIARGRAEIRDRFAAPTLQFSWHYFMKPQIEVGGDEARAQWDILAPCTTTEGVAMWMSGVEFDRYRRVDGLWLHQEMRLEVVFMAPHERGWAR